MKIVLSLILIIGVAFYLTMTMALGLLGLVGTSVAIDNPWLIPAVILANMFMTIFLASVISNLFKKAEPLPLGRGHVRITPPRPRIGR